MKIQWLPYFDSTDSGSGTGVIEKPAVKPEKQDDDTSFLDGLLGDKTEKDKDLIDEEDEELKDDKADNKDGEVDDEDAKDDDKEDELIVDTNIRAIDFKKIKEKFSDFSKTTEYRELKNSYYREGQYTELFPTIEDAREAAENNATFNKLNDAIVNNGDSLTLLEAVKGASPAALQKFSLGFLDNLARFDKGLYVETITPVIKRLARQIYANGKNVLKRNAESEDGLALVATARNIMQYSFEDPDLVDKNDEVQDPKIKAREDELNTREKQIRQDKFVGAYNVAFNSVERHLDKLITDGLDPNNSMNEFTKDSLTEKIKSAVKKQLDTDNPHLRRMESLWKRSENEGYSKESLSRIVSAYLERARPIIASTRTKLKSVALKGSRRVERDDESENEKPLRIANRGSSGRPAVRDGKVNVKSVDPRKIDYSKTSDDDIFDGKVSLKG